METSELTIKDLMIGDWVVINNIPRQVTFIDDCLNYKIIARGKHPDSGMVSYVGKLSEEVKPIPLTSEILEKNGWVYNNEDEKFFPQTWVGGGLMLQGADDCGYRIVVTSDYDDEDTNNTPFIILYVHELQHALRLRRINKEIVL